MMTDGIIIVIIIIIATKRAAGGRRKVKLTTSPPFFGFNEYGAEGSRRQKETTAIDYDVIFWLVVFLFSASSSLHTTFSAFGVERIRSAEECSRAARMIRIICLILRCFICGR